MSELNEVFLSLLNRRNIHFVSSFSCILSNFPNYPSLNLPLHYALSLSLNVKALHIYTGY